jgi:hypothetical protein
VGVGGRDYCRRGERGSPLLTVVVERHGADSRRETRGDQVACVTRPAVRGLQVHEPLAAVRPRRAGAGGWGGFAAGPRVLTGLGPAAHGGFEGARWRAWMPSLDGPQHHSRTIQYERCGERCYAITIICTHLRWWRACDRHPSDCLHSLHPQSTSVADNRQHALC